MQPSEASVVMISGAGRGIGLAIARRLNALGYRLSLGIRNPEARSAATREFPAESIVFPYEADDPESARVWVKSTIERCQGIYGVVANAGIYLPWTIEDADEAIEQLWVTNLRGPQRLVSAAWPYLKESGNGRVITIASMSGLRVSGAESTGYATVKHALVGLTKGIQHSGWEYGIRATAICPGYVASDMSAYATVPQNAMTQSETIASMVELALTIDGNSYFPILPVASSLE